MKQLQILHQIQSKKNLKHQRHQRKQELMMQAHLTGKPTQKSSFRSTSHLATAVLATSPRPSRGCLELTDKASTTLNSTQNQSTELSLKKMLLKKIKRYEKEVTCLNDLVRDQAVELGDRA